MFEAPRLLSLVFFHERCDSFAEPLYSPMTGVECMFPCGAKALRVSGCQKLPLSVWLVSLVGFQI